MHDSKAFVVGRHHPSRDHELKGRAFMDAVHDYYEEKDAVMRDVLSLAEDRRCLFILDIDSGRWWYLHPSLRVDGWQLTRWDERGPVCHSNVGHDPHELAYDLPDNFDCYYVA